MLEQAIKLVEEEIKDKKQKGSKQSRWSEILAKAKHINLVAYTENLDEAEFKMLPETNFHQHLMPMLEDIATPEVIQRVKNAPGFIAVVCGVKSTVHL